MFDHASPGVASSPLGYTLHVGQLRGFSGRHKEPLQTLTSRAILYRNGQGRFLRSLGMNLCMLTLPHLLIESAVQRSASGQVRSGNKYRHGSSCCCSCPRPYRQTFRGFTYSKHCWCQSFPQQLNQPFWCTAYISCASSNCMGRFKGQQVCSGSAS